MSTQSDAKLEQGYSDKPHNCGNCSRLKFEMALPRWMRDANSDACENGRAPRYGKSYEEQKNLRCGIGGFAVKKTARCALWGEKSV